MVDKEFNDISITRQAELLSLNRSALYYKSVDNNNKAQKDKILMDLIDEIYTEYPFYGRRKMTVVLRTKIDFSVNEKRVGKLMRVMGLEAIYPKPNTSKANQQHKKYKYLLTDLEITRPNQVWSTDITYIRLKGGFIYLVAIIDWYSRKVLSWQLSNTLDTRFCLEALDEALKHGKPEIFNTDQGCQFTSDEFTGRLISAGIAISMDGKGRALDNIFIERLWRTVKYEEVYPNCYENPLQARLRLTKYFKFYNNIRPHQSLNYATPSQVHEGKEIIKLKPLAKKGDKNSCYLQKEEGFDKILVGLS